MITNLLPYPFYKSSGVDWLGEVPAHWEVRPLKHWVGINETVLSEATDSDFGFDYLEIGAVSAGVLPDEPRRTRFGDAPSRARRVVSRGDTIVSTVRSYLNAVWFADETDNGLICSTGFAVLTPRQGTIPKYVGYLVQSSSFIDQMTAESVGIAYPAISEGKFSSSRVCIPPLAEQRAIVCYLDRVDRRIRRYIEAKEKLIALLQEARQAIIQRAVTRGLDPDVPFEPSGVDWLGDVPAHWEVRRLGQLATKFGSGITPRGGATVYQEDGIPFLRSQNIHFDGLRIRNVARIAPSLHQELSSSHVKPGDVLLNITGASIGRACSVPDSFAEGNVNQHVCIIRPHQSRLLPGLLAAYLSTPMMQREIQIEQKGASREGLTLQSIRNFRVIVPPLPEQAAIAVQLDRVTAAIDAAIDNARRQVEFMTEYRASLIAHVSTGKLDVRAAAEQLPQEVRELAVS